ncbi:MAG: peroxiredoxin [Granulosicoccus sp.]
MNSLTQVDWSTIPAPEDDGQAEHLTTMVMPSVSLSATDGTQVDLSKLEGLVVLYAYPMTGSPGTALPDGWDELPGARGCTPQSCAFRDHAVELEQLGVSAVFGLSTQSSEYQREAATRLNLPFSLLSDESLKLSHALRLPMLDVEGMTLTKRITLVIRDAVIVKVFYPVFPPDENANDVIAYLRSTAG